MILEGKDEGQAIAHGPGSLLDVGQVPADQGTLDHVLDQRDCLLGQLGEALPCLRARRGDEVGGVLALGQDQDGDVELMGLVESEGSFGRPGPGLVGVERQDGPVGEPGEEADVFLAQGGPASADRRGDAGLVKGDDIRIALHQEGPALPGDVGLRPVEVIEQRALVVEG